MNLNQEVRKRTRVISKKAEERTLIRKQRYHRRKKAGSLKRLVIQINLWQERDQGKKKHKKGTSNIKNF